MHCLLQRNYRTSVKKEKNSLLSAETSYCEGPLEAIAQLWLNQNSFKITEAYLETHNGNNGQIQPVPEVYGIEAYLETGKQLRHALGKYGLLAFELFAETVRGIIQAETFLYKERGYASAAEYSKYFETMYVGSCRYYSHLDRITYSWDEYVNDSGREGYLFLRNKTYFLYTSGNNTYQVVGGLRDTFHEINVTLTVSDGLIQNAEGNTLRIPDPVCSEAVIFLEKLRGIHIDTLSKKEIAGLMGKGDGCVHLIDMIHDSLKTVKDYLGDTL